MVGPVAGTGARRLARTGGSPFVGILVGAWAAILAIWRLSAVQFGAQGGPGEQVGALGYREGR